jgi:hypothetical protein
MVTGAILFGLLLLAACGGDDDPVQPRPEDVLTVRSESEHGVYYHAPGDAVDRAAQEAYYDWLFPRIGIEPTQPLVLFKYRNRAHMIEVTGEDTNGWAEIGTYRFHTISPWDNHECVHALLSATLGLAPSLINEGFPVAHQTLPILGIMEPIWNGTHIDTLAARFKREDRIPPLATLLRSRDFFDYDTNMTYPMAGSFTRSLLKRYGYAPVKEFFRVSEFEDDGATFRANFSATFGEDVEEAWATWLDALGG